MEIGLVIVTLLGTTIGGLFGMIIGGTLRTGLRDWATLRDHRKKVEANLYPFFRACDLEPTVMLPLPVGATSENNGGELVK